MMVKKGGASEKCLAPITLLINSNAIGILKFNFQDDTICILKFNFQDDATCILKFNFQDEATCDFPEWLRYKCLDLFVSLHHKT